jgi:aminoglycoside phosphotransferase (APT) family kinase protein
MDDVAQWLALNLPGEPAEATVVHGDYKLDNVLLSPLDPGQLVAILDWEMCALGDPLVDLGIMLAYWSGAGTDGGTDALATVTTRPGYLSRGELIERYARQSGRDVSRIAFYETFALFKIAVVIQQIYVRYVRGQTRDARFAPLGARVAELAGAARARSADAKASR